MVQRNAIMNLGFFFNVGCILTSWWRTSFSARTLLHRPQRVPSRYHFSSHSTVQCRTLTYWLSREFYIKRSIMIIKTNKQKHSGRFYLFLDLGTAISLQTRWPRNHSSILTIGNFFFSPQHIRQLSCQHSFLLKVHQGLLLAGKTVPIKSSADVTLHRVLHPLSHTLNNSQHIFTY